jgi:hypothetical protein
LLSTESSLILYYLGFGFVALLGWAAIAGDLNRPFDDARSTAWNRAATVLAVVGLCHPALPLIARDIARQAARREEETLASRQVTLAVVCAVLSFVIAGVVVVTATR